MIGFGVALALLGLGMALAGFGFDTMIDVPDALGIGTDRVVNLQRQQQQLLIVLTGLATFQAGIILAAAGAILGALRPSAEPAEPAPEKHD
jgi:uncharacterized membrane protein YidH (DUF202 family)